jgi:hypothetical protein
MSDKNFAAVACLPGITMAKPLFPDIEEWLERVAVRQVVIAYDNEAKDDRNLPGYKAEEWKRHDAQIWARYLARQLQKEGYDARVCVLPKEWRDSKGKADWDGALAQKLTELNGKREDLEGEVTIRGYHEPSRCWFFRDVTMGPDGKEYRADRKGILWIDTWLTSWRTRITKTKLSGTESRGCIRTRARSKWRAGGRARQILRLSWRRCARCS